MLTENQLSQASTVASSQTAAFDQTAFAESMKEAFNKPRDWDSFDLESKLASLQCNMLQLFPSAHQPSVYAVRKLATRIRQAHKESGHSPFLFVDMREYLPSFCSDHLVVNALRDVVNEDKNVVKAR